MSFFNDIPIVSDILGSPTTERSEYGALGTDQLALKKYLADMAGGTLDKGATRYPGQMYTPQTQQETNYFGQVDKNVQNADAYQQALSQILRGTPAYQVDPQVSKSYFENTIKPIYTKTFNETTLPQLNSSFAGPGFWSDARAKAMEKGISDFGLGLSAQESNLAYQDELARRQSLTEAFNRIPGAVSTATAIGTNASEQLGKSAEYSRAMSNEKVMSDLQRWLSGEPMIDPITGQSVRDDMNNPAIKLAMSLLGITETLYGTDVSAGGVLYGFLSSGGSGFGQAVGNRVGSSTGGGNTGSTTQAGGGGAMSEGGNTAAYSGASSGNSYPAFQTDSSLALSQEQI